MGKETSTILHIAPTPFFSDRGCHIRIRNEIEALQGNAYAVILCTYPLGEPVAGIDIRRTWRISGYVKTAAGFSPYRLLADFLLFWLVLKVAFQEKPSMLHAHLHEGVVIGAVVRICLFWRRLPLIMDMQGSLTGELTGYGSLRSNSLLAKVVHGIEWVIYRLPAVIFCSSEKSRAIVQEEFGGMRLPVSVVPDVVPNVFFQAVDRHVVRGELGVPENKTVLIYSGALVHGKGFNHVLETMRKVLSKRQDLLFLLIGYPLEEAEAFIRENGLAQFALLTGRMPYYELAKWLLIADLALEPKEDGSGEASGKLLHYMAAGLPVVCYKTANNWAVLGELGYYAQLGTDLTDAVMQAVDDTAGRNQRGRAGRELTLRSYSFQQVREVLTQQYASLAA